MTRLQIKLGALVVVLIGLAIFGNTGFRMTSGAPDVVARVWDAANILTPAQRKAIAEYHRVLQTDFDTELGVMTVKGNVDVARVAVEQFAAREIGHTSHTGRGVLLVIAPDSQKVRLEVSEALEPVFTDTFAAYLEQRQMVPFFQSGRVADGILATTELIYNRAVEAQRGQAFDPRVQAAASGGGGAQTGVTIGAGYNQAALQQQTARMAAGRSPLETVEAYLTAMSARDARSDLPIYSQASQQMMARWTVTAGQMDNVVRTYRSCGAAEVRMVKGGRAVVRYPVENRTCSPWFLVEESGAWRLDLTMMQTAIRFNARNQWHFEPGVQHAYGDAFRDWRFDQYGFPHATGP